MSRPPKMKTPTDPLETEKIADRVLADPKATAAQKAAAKKLKGSSIVLQIARMAAAREAQGGMKSGVTAKGPGARTPVPKADPDSNAT